MCVCVCVCVYVCVCVCVCLCVLRGTQYLHFRVEKRDIDILRNVCKHNMRCRVSQLRITQYGSSET